MSVLDRLATAQGRRDEVLNQELARDLAASKDEAAIREVAQNLWSKDRNIQADCIKVLYEIGYLDPSLIVVYAEDFVKLLKSRNNRLVWGGMIALSTIGRQAAEALYPHVEAIQKVMTRGSVITVDAGVAALAGIAADSPARGDAIFPFLLRHLETCRPKDVPQHAEKSLPAVRPENRADFAAVLQKRLGDLSGAQVKRVEKVLRAAEKLA